eukprot:scpid75172/ scgid3872/ 
MTTYDYAIVGAGLIGSACAKYVSQSLSDEKSVCLIGPDPPSAAERQAGSTRIAFGADDDEGRIVTCDTISDPLGAALARKTIARFGQIQASTGVQFFSEVGCMTVVGSPDQSKAVREYVDTLLASSYCRATPVRPISGRFPFLAGISDVCCGVLASTNAGHVSPRKLVLAQLMLARRHGCKVIRDVVMSVRDHGDHYRVLLQSGTAVLARRVLLATGVSSVWPSLLPQQLRLLAVPQTQTTLLAEVSEECARSVLHGMPGMWVRDFWHNGGTDNTKLSPSLAYILPAIRYPDGRWYLKIGHGKLHDNPIPPEPQTIAEWYRSHDMAVGDHLHDILRSIMPSLLPISLRLNSCATLTTPTNLPYIDVLPGTQRPGTLYVATGGNGGAAKSCDEIGRLAAGLLVKGAWLSDLPRERFRARFIGADKFPPSSRL